MQQISGHDETLADKSQMFYTAVTAQSVQKDTRFRGGGRKGLTTRCNIAHNTVKTHIK